MKIYAQLENSVFQLSIYFKSQLHAFNKINSKPLLELDGYMPSCTSIRIDPRQKKDWSRRILGLTPKRPLLYSEICF